MRQTLAVLLSATVILGWSPPARATDPTTLDVLTLRLYSSPSEVLQLLRAQGINEAKMWITPPECPANAPDACATAISAFIRDGRILVQFTDAPVTDTLGGSRRRIAYRIAYTIIARGPTDTALVRGDAIDHYGPPSSISTTAWCAELDAATATCPADRPVLRLAPTPGAAALMTLSDDGLTAQVRR
jgi:hypothetical protein